MNLNQLYYLQAIAQARGLTRAADASMSLSPT